MRRTRAVIAAEHAAAAEVAVAGSAVDVAEPADVEETAPQEAPVPAPSADLSPEQRQIKELKDQLAREKGRKDAEPEVDDIANPGDEGNIVIHFLEDGLTVNGRVMYRGDELEFEVGSPAHKDTFNRFGKSWLDYRSDEFGQVDRWGKIMFRNGPWPGKTYADGKWETVRSSSGDGFVAPPTEAEIEAAEKARRRRAAPRLPQQV